MKKAWLYLIGIALFVIVLLNIDIGKTIETIKNANIGYFWWSVALLLPMILLKAWRWQYLMKMQGIRYNLWDCFVMYYVGLAIGILTPGKLGDFAKIYYLKEDGHSTGKAFFSSFMDRVVDVFWLLVFGYISLIVFASIFRKQVYALSILAAVSIIAAAIAYWKRRWIKKQLHPLFHFLVPESYRSKIKLNKDDFMNDLKKMSAKDIAVVSCQSIAARVIYYVQMYLLALAVGVNLPFLVVSAFVTVITVGAFVPISFSNIGPREAILVVLFLRVGLTSESAVAFSLFMLLNMWAAALIGILFWFVKPIRFGKIKESKGQVR